MIYSDSTDPWAYGLFKDEKTAQKFKERYQLTWNSREWYQLSAHIIKIERGKQ
tara:strand:+ start:559 stop:717 length:159 start_codon:yes stop_codon:yes gene_type:complete